jgi:hypothetical protein
MASSNERLLKAIKKLHSVIVTKEFDAADLYSELRSIAKQAERTASLKGISKFISQKKLSASVPDAFTASRIHLTFVSVASGDRRFSKLKLIKNKKVTLSYDKVTTSWTLQSVNAFFSY